MPIIITFYTFMFNESFRILPNHFMFKSSCIIIKRRFNEFTCFSAGPKSSLRSYVEMQEEFYHFLMIDLRTPQIKVLIVAALMRQISINIR